MLEAAIGLTPRERARGCLLAGACGDALGAPVEFMRDREIRARFGLGGIRDMAPAYGKAGAITDDTQMTLFTAEGLIRAHLRWLGSGITNLPGLYLTLQAA
jgi:ADP-ribosylglycohydrolase